MSPAAKPSLAAQIKRVPAAVRPIVQAAVRTVETIAPSAEAVTYRSEPPRSKSAMWKLVRYAVDGEFVVGIGTFASHSTMFFYRGRELDDGGGLLAGGGRDARFVTLSSPADAEQAEVRRLVRRAFRLAGKPPARSK